MIKALYQQWRHLLSNKDALLAIFVALILYALIYPQPYRHQTAINQPLAVVDLDNSRLSRQVIRMVDANPGVQVRGIYGSRREAKQAMVEGEVAGLLTIPEDFYKRVVSGRSVELSYAADASYFLVYSAIAQAVSAAGTTVAATIKVLQSSLNGNAALAHSWWPFVPKLMASFNTTGGYASYVIPGVFVMLLHQTLLLGSALLSVGERRAHAQAGQLLLARACVLVGIYAVIAHICFGYFFEQYAVATAMRYRDLWLLLLPFLFATTMAGTLLGLYCQRQDKPSQIIFISSMPLLFVSGFIWPIQSLPEWLVAVSYWMPSTHAIGSFLKVNQMGAELSQVMPSIIWLWALSLLYGGWAWWLMRKPTA